VEQLELNKSEKSTKLDQYSREDLIKQNQFLESELSRTIKEIYKLKYSDLTEDQLNLVLQEHLQELRNEVYGASSERLKSPNPKPKKEKPPEPRVRLPSERYPNIPVREINLTVEPPPGCTACGKRMSDSGMTEDSEQLNVIQKKYEILKYKRSVYRCTCQSCMKTTDMPPRIIEGSSYSDDMVLDVVLSKYCDLIPVERYAQMAARGGVMGIPPNSLIDLTHKFALFVKGVYWLIEDGCLNARVLRADETPHRMLEGSDKKSWYLWGFSTDKLCFLECHNTRSGDVASQMLTKSKCEVLLTDVYAGYHKATGLANAQRLSNKMLQILNANCNAHARRYFFKTREKYSEANYYLEQYQKIYALNTESKDKPPDEVLNLRAQMNKYFIAMRDQAMQELARYPKGNKYEKALSYYLNNYDGLTVFLIDAEVPIDNNAQERLLRSHVVGRKTWYGTHSEQGAETAAILFSIVETCKLNGVNPREYFPALIKDLLDGKKPYTPSDFKLNS
jgi:transposase